MDFRQLQYFVAAVEQRSMSAAARVCRVTQPTLSAQIRRLELELDGVLFERTAIGLRPTKSAQLLYRRLAPLLCDAAHGFRYIRSGSEQPADVLHVVMDYSAASLMGVMAREAARLLERQYPHLKIVQHASERGAISAPQRHVRLRHVARAGSAATPADPWLLIEVAVKSDSGRRAGRRRGDDESSLSFDGGVDVPLLPAEVQAALAEYWQRAGRGPLRAHEEDAAGLIASMLVRNSGRVLLPRLAVSRALAGHPRLRVREMAAGLPPLSAVAEPADAEDPVQRAYCAAFGDRLTNSKRMSDPVPPASLPDARQLRYFLRTFDEGGITRAAAKLNVVQPAVSMQIRALERKFGGRLFDRTRQGIHPTPLGRKVRAVYAPILEALQGGTRVGPDGRPHTRPILRVGVLPGLDEESLLVQATTATIMEWRKSFAHVELKVVEAYSGVLLDWLADNAVDIAIVEDMHARASLRQTILSSEPLAVLTATRRSMCPPGPIKMAEIAQLDLVLPSPRHGLRALLDRKFAAAGLPLVPKLELDSMASAVRLVKSGGWATVMPSSAVRPSLDRHALEAHPIVQPMIIRELRAVQLIRHPVRYWEKEFIRLLGTRLSCGVGDRHDDLVSAGA
jgi:LysR family nitrogen assimilation transcriptional regulator